MSNIIVLIFTGTWFAFLFTLDFSGRLQTARDLFKNRGAIMRIVGNILTFKWLPAVVFFIAVVLLIAMQAGWFVAKRQQQPATTTVSRPMSFSEMTNDELRVATQKYVARLRKFNNEFAVTDERIDGQDRDKQMSLPPEKVHEAMMAYLRRSAKRRQRFTNAFQDNFLTDARLLDKELRKRVDGAVLAPNDEENNRRQLVRSVIGDAPSLSGPVGWGIEELSAYLEELSRQLPDSSENYTPRLP